MKRNLFTSSSNIAGFEPGYVAELARFARKLCAILAVFALFELAASMFSPVAHPLQAPSDEKQRHYENVLLDDDHYDVFMLGSSMTQSAFDPDVFDPVFGGRSFNAGIAGRSDTTWQLAMLREIIARKKPATVIYAIESWSLGATPHVPNTQMFRFLKLYQNRKGIQRWLKQTLCGRFSKPPAFLPPEDKIWQVDKRFEFFKTQTLHPTGFLDVDALARADFQGVVGPFKVLTEQARALETMMTLTRAAGIDLVFVQLPEYTGEIERWRERHDDFRAYMREHVVAKGYTYFDFSDLDFPRDQIDLFYDVNHLNGTGGRQLTAALAKLMKERRDAAHNAE